MRCIMLWPLLCKYIAQEDKSLQCLACCLQKWQDLAIPQPDDLSNSACMPIELSSSAGVHTGNGRMCLEGRARCRQQGRFTFAAPVHGAMLPLLCEGQSRSQGVAEHAQECCQPRGFRACCSLANYRLHHAHSELQCHMFCTASKQRCWKQSLNDPEMLMPGVAWFRQLEHCLFLPHAFI